MKKLIICFVLLFALVTSANGMTLAWDSYTDDTATGLRIESSLDNSNWVTEVDNIATDKIASDVANGPDGTRVYYRMVAFNDTETSTPSNVVSFFWTTGGGGYEGIAPVDGIKLLDCDAIDLDPNHPDYATCQGRHTLP